MATTYIWHLRNPDGASMGLEFATGRSAPTVTMLGHSLPERVDVEVRDEASAMIARADGLEHEAVTPMSRLTLRNGSIERENVSLASRASSERRIEWSPPWRRRRSCRVAASPSSLRAGTARGVHGAQCVRRAAPAIPPICPPSFSGPTLG